MRLVLKRLAARLLAACVALLFTAVLAGAASDAAPKTPAVSGPPLPIRIAAYTGITVPIFALQAALVLGEFQRAGLDPTMTETIATNLIPLVVSNRADVACSSGPFFAGLLAGQQFTTIVGVGAAQPYSLIVRTSIRSIEDLRGKTIGVPDTTAQTTFLIMQKLLAEHHMKSSDVNYVVMATVPDRTAAILSGRLDATLLDIDSSLSIAGQPGVKVLMNNPAGSNFNLPYIVCFANKSYAAAHTEELRRFALAMIQTQRDLTQKPQFIAAVGKAMPGHYPPELLEKVYGYYTEIGFWAVNGGLDPSWIKDTLATQTAAHPNSTNVSLPDFFTTAYARWALDQVGGTVRTKSDQGAWYRQR